MVERGVTSWAFEKGGGKCIFGWAKNYKIGVLLMENGKWKMVYNFYPCGMTPHPNPLLRGEGAAVRELCERYGYG